MSPGWVLFALQRTSADFIALFSQQLKNLAGGCLLTLSLKSCSGDYGMEKPFSLNFQKLSEILPELSVGAVSRVHAVKSSYRKLQMALQLECLYWMVADFLRYRSRRIQPDQRPTDHIELATEHGIYEISLWGKFYFFLGENTRPHPFRIFCSFWYSNPLKPV